MDVTTRAAVARRGRLLQYLTVLWNSAECIVALVGFGFDSAMEASSSLPALWRLRSNAVERDRERAEGRTLRIIGVCFMLLAGYVLYDAIRTLLTREPPSVSTAGIIITGLSLIVMPILVGAKRRVAASLQSSALEAEARQTRVCAYLSGIVLGGLALNAAFGWWWADPVAGLAMTPLIAWEGWQALTGQTCCDT